MSTEKYGKIRMSEIFVSFQGEGPKTGVPTSFVRTAGCNFFCSGWGVKTTLPDGTEVTGCDSPHSVFPQLFNQKGWSKMVESDELLELIPSYPKNVCLTGGEPLLQVKALTPVIEGLVDRGQTVEIFTNGSQLSYISAGHPGEEVTHVMDYKLTSSGEGGKFNEKNFDRLNSWDMVKFVIGDKDDYLEAKSVIEKFRDKAWCQFSMGVVFNKLSPVTLIEWITSDELEVRLNLQTQSLVSSDEGEIFDLGERSMKKVL